MGAYNQMTQYILVERNRDYLTDRTIIHGYNLKHVLKHAKRYIRTHKHPHIENTVNGISPYKCSAAYIRNNGYRLLARTSLVYYIILKVEKTDPKVWEDKIASHIV